MDSAVRVTILMLTIIALIYILSHQPRPVTVTVIPYCEISIHRAFKDREGEWHYRWVTDMGLCTLADRYENV